MLKLLVNIRRRKSWASCIVFLIFIYIKIPINFSPTFNMNERFELNEQIIKSFKFGSYFLFHWWRTNEFEIFYGILISLKAIVKLKMKIRWVWWHDNGRKIEVSMKNMIIFIFETKNTWMSMIFQAEEGKNKKRQLDFSW